MKRELGPEWWLEPDHKGPGPRRGLYPEGKRQSLEVVL